MSAGGRRCLCALALAQGCGEDELRIRLDVSKNCNEVEVETVLTDVGADTAGLLGAAMDPHSPIVWLLVRMESEGTAFVQVQRVVEGVVDFQAILPTPPVAGTMELRAAPDAAQAWVVHRGTGTFRVWRVDPSLEGGGVQSSQELVAFPHDAFTCAPCDTADWYRELVFLDQRPYIVSVPPFSPTAAVSFWVGGLVSAPPDTGTIEVGTEHRLNFERTCPSTGDALEDEACEASKSQVSYPEITVLGRQVDPRPESARMLVQRERAEETEPATVPDVFVVSLAIDLDGVPQGILRSYQDPNEATPSPPHGIAVDEFASYVLYTSQFVGPRFLRLASPPGELDFEDLTAAVEPIDFDTQVLQLDADIGLGRVIDGAWEITKIFPDALIRSETTTYTTDAPIVAADGIGGGTFLLGKEGRAPEVVRLRCVDPPLD